MARGTVQPGDTGGVGAVSDIGHAGGVGGAGGVGAAGGVDGVGTIRGIGAVRGSFLLDGRSASSSGWCFGGCGVARAGPGVAGRCSRNGGAALEAT